MMVLGAVATSSHCQLHAALPRLGGLDVSLCCVCVYGVHDAAATIHSIITVEYMLRYAACVSSKLE